MLLATRWSGLSAIATSLALSACHTESSGARSASGATAANAAPTSRELSNAQRLDLPPSAIRGASLGTQLPQPTCPAPKDVGVRLIGRHDGCEAAGPRQSWSGSGFVARFSGTGLNVALAGPAVTFTTLVDGATRSEFTTAAGKAVYALATGLPPGDHEVLVSRQGEASFGAIVLEAVTVAEGRLLEPPPAPLRRIELVGDSISAGYGNEGTSPSCPFSAETENHYLTYGAILARHFDAELSTVAWSGKGIVSNYGGDRNEPMPVLYDRADANDPRSVWDYRSWQADAVIVNLGTNDYSTEHDPQSEEFTLAYANLLATTRYRYPKAYILCTIGPLLHGTDAKEAEHNIEAAVASRARAGDRSLSFHAMRVTNTNPGCDWHPGLATHRAMAEAIAPALSVALGW